MFNVLVSGRNGFLMRNTLPVLKEKYEIIEFNYNQYSFNGYTDIDLILHFASPSDSNDFQDKRNMAFAMVDLTQIMIKIAKENNCKFIFASSMSAQFLEDDYGIYKKAMEQYIQALLKDYLILRIPRVYGKDRNKGLMRKIRQGLIPNNEMNNIIEYIDIEDFKVWFNQNLNKNGILYYSNEFRTNTIKEIGEIYCES